jgi:hypothetical protein
MAVSNWTSECYEIYMLVNKPYFKNVQYLLKEVEVSPYSEGPPIEMLEHIFL